MSELDTIEVSDLVAMRQVLRRLVATSDMSTATMEQIAGLPAGYISKVLKQRPLRGLTGNTIFLLTAVLGRKVVLAHDPEAEARIKSHRDYTVCTTHQRRRGTRHAQRLSIMRQLAKLSVPARMVKLSAAERSRIARKAARARWRQARRRTPPVGAGGVVGRARGAQSASGNP